MAICSKHHEELNKEGIGKCSVPVWMSGLPAGFCDSVAYGTLTEEGKLRYKGYVPFLACPVHGGPEKCITKKEINL